MRTKVASSSIRDDPETLAEWIKRYSAKEDVVKLKLEKKGAVWKLTVYYRD